MSILFQFLKHWAPLCWKSPYYLFVIRFNRYFSIELEKKCDLWSEWREECYNWSFFSWLYILVLHIVLHSDRPGKAVRNIKASSCIMVLMNWSRWKEMPSITLCWRSYHYGMHINYQVWYYYHTYRYLKCNTI